MYTLYRWLLKVDALQLPLIFNKDTHKPDVYKLYTSCVINNKYDMVDNQCTSYSCQELLGP